MGLLDRLRGSRKGLRIHVLIKGRIGPGWYDVDRTLRVPDGSTLSDLVSVATDAGIPMADALEHSPHLAHTLMINGERCPSEEHATRRLADGDQVYLLAPLAGG